MPAHERGWQGLPDRIDRVAEGRLTPDRAPRPNLDPALADAPGEGGGPGYGQNRNKLFGDAVVGRGGGKVRYPSRNAAPHSFRSLSARAFRRERDNGAVADPRWRSEREVSRVRRMR